MYLEEKFKLVNVLEYVKTHFTEKEYQYVYKIKPVKARVGILGEEVVTVMRNGLIETKNNVKYDEEIKKNDKVITNLDEEKYIITHKTFLEKYEQQVIDGYYKPKQKLITVVQINENISFIAPWGSVMNIAKDGFLVINNEHDIYGIQKEEFLNTYKLAV